MLKFIASATLTSIGVFGGAITLLSSAHTMLELSHWIRYFVTNWVDWLQSAWVIILNLIPLPLLPGDQLQVTMALFLVCVAFGALLQERTQRNHCARHKIKITNVLRFNVLLAAMIFCIYVASFHYLYTSDNWTEWYLKNRIFVHAASNTVYLITIIIALIHWGVGYAFGMAVACLVMSYFMITAPEIKTTVYSYAELRKSESIATFLVIISFGIVILISPPQKMLRRTWSILILFFSILILNEIAKLNISLIAPET